MALETRLANGLIRNHPGRAASVLERVTPAEAARALERTRVAQAAALLGRLSPQQAADVLDVTSDERVAALFEELSTGIASRLARRLREGRADAVLDAMPARAARGIRALIRFPEHTAGALMDPNVLALSESFTAREALERVRELPEQARYNLYVVDPEQKLVGAVNLRELLLAKPSAKLSDVMVRNPIALTASADRAAVVSHPGWKEVHSLPVVDEQGGYLGAVRYRTLRELEDLLFRGSHRDADAQAALGQLFAAGAAGLVDAIAPRPPGTGGA
jgi:magnesium transporter